MTSAVRLSLVLEAGDARADAERLRLLEAIEAAGSITGAARRLSLSYRAAWTSVQHLNGLFGIALVEASTGGPGGGGRASLTAAGRQLKADLAALEGELQDVVARMAARLAAPGSSISPVRWPARVRATDGAEVSLLSERGTPVVALQDQPDLATGSKALIVIPPRAVLLTRSRVEGTSARNQWVAKVAGREDRDEATRLLLDLPSGDRLQASLTRASAEELGLMAEVDVFALVKASQVSVVAY